MANTVAGGLYKNANGEYVTANGVIVPEADALKMLGIKPKKPVKAEGETDESVNPPESEIKNV